MLNIRSDEEAMNLMELKERIAQARGYAVVKAKLTGPVDAEGCVEITCVETVTNDEGQTIVFSDEPAE